MILTLDYIDDSLSYLLTVAKRLTESTIVLGDGPVAFKVKTFASDHEYLEALAEPSTKRPDIILIDVAIDDEPRAGVGLAAKARQAHPDAVIVMFTQHDDADLIVDCLAAGVDNFLNKKQAFKTLPQALIDTYAFAMSNRTLPASVVGAGRTMAAIEARIPAIIHSAIRCIHVHGDTGTGKEVVADAFARALGPAVPFLRINCAAISPTLVESEFFGHKRGAFTGAHSDRAGVLEEASGGFVFLDEVGLLEPHAQQTLLRAIENQTIRRVGESESRAIKVRVISATNENLANQVAAGTFRRDLWQRLCETKIYLPPLRERLDELPELVGRFAQAMEGGPYTVPSTTLEVLKQHDWSDGNVRELRNVLRAMTERQMNRVLWPTAIPREFLEAISMQVGRQPSGDTISVAVGADSFSYEAAEEQFLASIIKWLADSEPNMTINRLQHRMGLSRSTLRRRIPELIQKGLIPDDLFS